MQLHRIRLKNFRLHADTDLHFENGITAVVGPNGVGKSTLLEAIAWAFFGTAAARGPRDSIRRTDAAARDPVRVEIEFSLGAHEYKVVRKMNNAELFQDGGNAPIANSTRTVSERVENILGMSRDEFFNTYFTGQKELTVMASLGPAERGKFLSRLMGYERLREAQTQLRARRSDIKSAIAEVERTIEGESKLHEERALLSKRADDTRAEAKGTGERRTRAAEAIEAIAPVWYELQERRDKHTVLQNNLNIASQAADEARRDLTRLNSELSIALEARKEADVLKPVLEQSASLRSEYDVLDRAAQSAGRRRDLHGESKAIEEQLRVVAERLKELVTVQAVVTKAETSERKAKKTLRSLAEQKDQAKSVWDRNRQEAETKQVELRRGYKAVKEDRGRLEQEGTEGKCPICARPLGSEFDTVLETISRQLEEIESQGVFLKSRIKQLVGEPDELKGLRREQTRIEREQKGALDALVRARAQLQERADAEREHERLCARQAELGAEMERLPDAYNVDRHEELRVIIRKMENDVVRAAALATRAEKADELIPKAGQAEQHCTTCEKTVKELSQAVTDLAFNEAAFAKARDGFAAADLELRDAELAVRDVTGQVTIVETQLAAVDQRLQDNADRVKRLTELRVDFGLHDELDTALDELRRELNARLRPELSEVASGFLSELTDGRYHEIEITEKYEVLMLEDGIPKSVISGGEEDIANLVLRIAISQMVAERAGQPLSLLVFDEIFGGLDDDRRRNVIELLRGLAARFPQVILITHIEHVKHGVDRVFRVQLDPKGGFASVVEDDIEVPGEEHAAA